MEDKVLTRSKRLKGMVLTEASKSYEYLYYSGGFNYSVEANSGSFFCCTSLGSAGEVTIRYWSITTADQEYGPENVELLPGFRSHFITC